MDPNNRTPPPLGNVPPAGLQSGWEGYGPWRGDTIIRVHGVHEKIPPAQSAQIYDPNDHRSLGDGQRAWETNEGP